MGLKGCAYRWFSTTEICMILKRFNTLAFIGDGSASMIYRSFNVLLREDLRYGTVKDWEMASWQQNSCECLTMFISRESKIGPYQECEWFMVTGSDQFSGWVGESRYHCNSEFFHVININKR